MVDTRFAGPVSSGDVFFTYTNDGIAGPNPGVAVTYNQNVGLAVLAQTATLNAASVTTVSVTMWVPVNSQILAVYDTTETAWSTTSTLSVGTIANGSAYVNAMTVTGSGSVATTTMGSASVSVGTNTAVVFSISATSGSTTAGTSVVTLQYVQTTSTFS
jgi:hypothetical protein